jgi:long-chain acyl-CoA synthetase
MYGQTEAGPRIAYLPPDMAAKVPEAIGVPIPGVEIVLVDEEGAPCADGAPGEIVVHGPSVMMGYAQTKDDLQRGDDMDGVLHTGDLAVRGEDGLLRIVGRRSRILKIYGLRVNVDEIQGRLSDMGYDAHCFGADDQLRILLPEGEDSSAVRQSVVDLFCLPPRSVEVRSAAGSLNRLKAGKMSSATLTQAWEAAQASQ